MIRDWLAVGLKSLACSYLISFYGLLYMYNNMYALHVLMILSLRMFYIVFNLLFCIPLGIYSSVTLHMQLHFTSACNVAMPIQGLVLFGTSHYIDLCVCVLQDLLNMVCKT